MTSKIDDFFFIIISLFWISSNGAFKIVRLVFHNFFFAGLDSYRPPKVSWLCLHVLVCKNLISKNEVYE